MPATYITSLIEKCGTGGKDFAGPSGNYSRVDFMNEKYALLFSVSEVETGGGGVYIIYFVCFVLICLYAFSLSLSFVRLSYNMNT